MLKEMLHKSSMLGILGMCVHSHKKWKDSLETRAFLPIFSLELEISGVAVQSTYQNGKGAKASEAV